MAFLLVTVFLNTLGMTIIGPVVPFLVEPYLADKGSLATTVGWLISAYALCQFLAAPGLGRLSDRFGRRPLLLLCLAGSVVGYLLFGIGGALWVLIVGRVIDGLTGGNISILFAYIADISAPEERGAVYGRVGAVAGLGFMLGPAAGGFAAHWGVAVPAYLAAAITLAALLWGLWALPESLPADRRSGQVRVSDLNPFIQLRDLLGLAHLRWLLLVGFLYALPFAALQANLSVLIIDSLGWSPAQLGLLFLLVGGADIVVQGVLVGRLLPILGERRLALCGFVTVMLGYILIGSIAVFPVSALLLIGTVLFAGGGGLVEPALGGMLSRAAGDADQGRVQGGSQAIHSLALILGPIIGGALYAGIVRPSPYLLGAICMALAMLVIGTQRGSKEPTTPQ
jgi:DHA1 family tetracycline resistance protein-like MFS transporter